MEKKNSVSGMLLLIIILVVAVAAALWYTSSRGYLASNSAGYKAVFVSNGQVYFGKLASGEKSDPIVLRDVYYPQLQPVAQSKTDTTAQPQGQLQLVKMGNETHGPKDEIRFNRSQVLYIEDLKEDGVVVKSIHSYQASGNQNTAPATGGTAVTSPAPAATK